MNLINIEAHCRSYLWSGTTAITKRALVAWERICTPKSAGGMNLINIKLWNRVAIAKINWDLAHKQDKPWIRWIHTYYIKGEHVNAITIPAQASWMIRKIIAARGVLDQLQTNKQVNIRDIYCKMIGDMPKVPWKTLMIRNEARPKAVFILWLQIQDKLVTINKLHNWGKDIDQTCILCRQQSETRDHLYIHCIYTTNVWRRIVRWQKWQWNQKTNWEEHLAWMIQSSRGRSVKTQIFKMVYAEMVYLIWAERNRRIFEKKSSQVEDIAKQIACISNIRAQNRTRNILYKLKF